MTNNEKDRVRQLRSVLMSYFESGDYEGLCGFWLDFPDFPYTDQEVAYIFASAQIQKNSEVVANIWDRLGQPLEGMAVDVLLNVTQHLLNLDRLDEAERNWEFVAKRYEDSGFDYEATFPHPHAAFE